MYGEPLDNTQRMFEIRSPPHLDLIDILTEAEYFRFLSYQERSSLSGVPNPEGYRSTFVAMGRRSGKSHLALFMLAYEAYLHSERGGNYSSMVLAQNHDMGRLLTTGFRSIIGREQLVTRETPYHISCSQESSLSDFYFRDIHRAISASSVGYDSLVFDEMAHARPTSDTFEWSDFLPSGKLLAISSPNGHDPLFHHQCNLYRNRNDALVLQIPTWESNPNVISYVVEEHGRGEHTFDSEYGASFNSTFVPESEESVVYDEGEPLEGPTKSRFQIIEEEFSS
jgi:hypothetical protein